MSGLLGGPITEGQEEIFEGDANCWELQRCFTYICMSNLPSFTFTYLITCLIETESPMYDLMVFLIKVIQIEIPGGK